MPVRNVVPVREAARSETTSYGFAVEVMDSHAGAVGPGPEAWPLQSASRWNAYTVGFAWSLAPLICDLFSLGVRACVKLQLDWLAWAPPGESAVGESVNRERESNRSGSSRNIATDAVHIQTAREALRSGKARARPEGSAAAPAATAQPAPHRAKSAAGDLL